MGICVPAGDRYPRQLKGIGVSRHRSAEAGAAAAEAGRLHQLPVRLGQMFATAERIRKRFDLRRQTELQLLTRTLDLVPRRAADDSAEIGMRLCVRADVEPSPVEFLYVVPGHQRIRDAALSIPERNR